MREDEKRTSASGPAVMARLDVLIYAAGTGGGKLTYTPHSVELTADANAGAACGVHAQVILSRLPREQIARVEVCSDPDDPEECDPPEAAGHPGCPA